MATFIALRVDRVWFVCTARRTGWGLTFAEAARAAGLRDESN